MSIWRTSGFSLSVFISTTYRQKSLDLQDLYLPIVALTRDPRYVSTEYSIKLEFLDVRTLVNIYLFDLPLSLNLTSFLFYYNKHYNKVPFI
jgi:hypothetical protein